MKSIIILGSTGSIGTNTLDIVQRFPDEFRVVGLTAGNNIDKLKPRSASSHPSPWRSLRNPPRHCSETGAPIFRLRSWPAKRALHRSQRGSMPNW